jgi:hypothetical protein
MGATVPNVAERAFLDVLFSSANSPKLRLFTNNLTPGSGTVLSDLTELGSAFATPIDLSTMAAAITNGSGLAQKSMASATFTFNSMWTGGTIYGWFITINPAATGDKLLMVKKFDTPVTQPGGTGTLVFNLDVYGTEV